MHAATYRGEAGWLQSAEQLGGHGSTVLDYCCAFSSPALVNHVHSEKLLHYQSTVLL